MGDLAGMKLDPIYMLRGKLRDLLNGNRRRRDSEATSGSGVEEIDLNNEMLLDAFMVLYEDSSKIRQAKEPYIKHFLSKYGPAIAEIRNLQINTQHFQIGDVIRRGTFGNVHLGKAKATGRICAVKVMDKFQPKIQKMLPLVDSEFAILTKASSQWIVDLKFAFQDVKRVYFVMEYVGDEDLSTCIQRNGGKLDEDDAKFYLAEIVLALNAIHTMGFIHRDLRPANVLLDKMGHVKLADFGSASRLNQDGKAVSAFSVAFESQQYVAPEVLLSLEDNVETVSPFCYGTECDYWSLGVLAYELVYGKSPFLGENSLATYNKIVSFKAPIDFPRSQIGSDGFQLLVSELLVEKKNRIGFGEALRHEAFYNIIWDSIRTEVPPYIPPTKDDEELSKCLAKEISTTAPDPPSGQPFRQIPFIGFTKTLEKAIRKTGGGGAYQLNRTLNASSSFLDTSDNSFLDDKDDVCARLQTELNTKSNILLERQRDMQLLESKLNESDGLLSQKDDEIAKLNGELKRAKCEMSQLSRDLNEEREIREQMKNQSVELVSDIKSSQQRKVAELEAGLDYQKELVAKRETYISELETEITTLRVEVQQCQGEIQKTLNTTGQLQQKSARSYRGSISMMESRLLQTSTELEDKIKEMNIQHEQELHALQNALKRHEEDVGELITEKDLEIEQLKGRLEESRSSREGTLEEMRLMRKKYDVTIKNLEKSLQELMDKNERLESERDSTTGSASIQEMLQTELDETRKEKTRLSLELEQINRESKVRQEKIDELDRIVKRLEGSLQGMEEQKNDLMNKMKELFQRGQDADVEKGASNILQEQLDKSQASLDATKELLFQEREKVKALEKSMSNIEMEYNGVKVDLRIANREKKELDEKLKAERSAVEGNAGKLKSLEETNKESQKKVLEMEKKVLKLTTKMEADAFEFKELEKVVADKNNQLKIVEENSVKAAEEIGKLKSQLQEFEKLQGKYDARQSEMKDKDRIIEQQARKIVNLITNIDVLKEALNVLDEQLKEFEAVVAQKTAALEAAHQSKTTLESENMNLKDEMKKIKSELNESKSLKLFVEQRLREAESSLKSEESSKSQEVKILKEKLEFMTEKSQELSDELDSISAQFEENEEAKNYLSKLVDNLRQECSMHKEDSSRMVTQLVKLKENNIQLSQGLEEAINKCEAYKNRVDSMNDDLLGLECEKNESETKLQSMLQQQIKLIEYLQTQNEALSIKKKKTFADRLFGRKENEPLFLTPGPGPAQMATPMKETPRRVLQEQNAVKNLEAEASKLKNHLAFLQKERESRAQQAEYEPALEEVRKDEVPPKSEKVSSAPVDVDSENMLKTYVYEELGTERAQINCVKNMFGDIFVLGCEDGLFSTRKKENQPFGRVKIGGTGAIKQIEFVSRQNMAIMIEGENRRLVSVHLGLLRSCAEAAACSKAKVTLHAVNDQIENCNLFQVKKTASSETALIVATDQNINLLFWDQDSFVIRKTIATPNPVKALLTTSKSLIFACEKMFELDIKNFSMDEFVDESDDSLFYVTTSSPEFCNSPIAILDVSMSNLSPGSTKYHPEYLLCFPDLAIFVDEYGRRSRPVDIVWSKLPVEVTYRYPDLIIVHLGSVEIIRLNKDSYTKTRVGLTKDSIGTEILNIPESHFIYCMAPRLLGTGTKSASVLVGTETRNKTQVLDLRLDEKVVSTSVSAYSVPFDLSSSEDSLSIKDSLSSNSDVAVNQVNFDSTSSDSD